MKRIKAVISGVVLAALIAVGGVSAQQANHTGSIVVKSDDEAGFANVARISMRHQFWGHHTYLLTLGLPRHIISAWQELQES
jgi:hypothetical protein